MAMPTESGSELMSHITAGGMIVYIIEGLKKSGWFPWMDFDTKRVNQLASFIMAIVAVVGISYTYDPALDGGTLIIHGLSWGAVSTMAWEVCKQYMAQQLIFDGIVAPKTADKLEGKR